MLAVVVAACVGPARSESDYRADIGNTATMAVSFIRSAQLTVDAVERGKAAAPYVGRRLTEDENGLGSVITSFGSVQPPSPDLDRLRAEVLALLNEAHSVVGELRIAAFRDHHDRMPSIGRPLDRLADELGTLDEIPTT